MQSFSDIPDLDAATIELFEAAGYLTPGSLAHSDPASIHAELAHANGMLALAEEVPSERQLRVWIEQVSEAGSVTEAANDKASTAESSKPPLGALDRAGVPYALPLSGTFVEVNRLDLDAIPVAQQDGKAVVENVREVRAKESVLPKPAANEARRAPSNRAVTAGKVEVERVRSLDEFRERGGPVEPVEVKREHDVTKSVRQETNEGVDPNSRRYIRGVLHTSPSAVVQGALGIILTQLLMLMSFLPLGLIFIDKDKYFWAAFSPLLLVVALITYFGMARKSFCPVCRQKQFVPKACRKHARAHAVPVLGHMLPTAFHILSFKWFRCIFCGTSIRLKE